MEKKVVPFVILLSLALLLFAMPIVSAQTYSGFNRLTDNVKLFFSSGDNKVSLALEIREREVNSALENLENNKETAGNLKRARDKLILVQKKVSANNAEKVKSNVNELKDKINEHQNLPEEFETYMLEEEKTQLTAELVVEVDGKEGQTLTREMVKDGTTGQNKVKIVVEGDNGEQKVIEIEGKIVQLENKIAERVVKIDMAGKVDKTDLENGVYIAKGEGNESVGLNPEVKTDIAEGTTRNDPLPEPDLNKINPDLYDPNAGTTTNIIERDAGENIIERGDCGDGVDCDDGSAEQETEGTNDISPAADSIEEDSDVTVTGEVIASEGRETFLGRFFKRVFGR